MVAALTMVGCMRRVRSNPTTISSAKLARTKWDHAAKRTRFGGWCIIGSPWWNKGYILQRRTAHMCLPIGGDDVVEPFAVLLVVWLLNFYKSTDELSAYNQIIDL